MPFTPKSIIEEARYVCNDIDLQEIYRQEDPELLLYVNSGLKEMSAFMPMMFSTLGEHACEAGKVEQSLSFTNAVRLLDVVCIQNGSSLTPFDRRVLDLFNPAWRIAAPGPAKHWNPKEGDPLAFYLDRPAPVDQVLDVQFVRNPSKYELEDEITDVPVAMMPALVDYVVYRAESKDDENVMNARAAAFYSAFKSKIGVVENGPAD